MSQNIQSGVNALVSMRKYKTQMEKVKSLTMLFIIYANTTLTQESDNAEINQCCQSIFITPRENPSWLNLAEPAPQAGASDFRVGV